MCGIGGFWRDAGSLGARDMLDAIDRALYHRGPDHGGRFVESDVGLLIRRLRIIDLETGDQPIANEDGSIVTVFNGEIYNHLDLRRQLESLGHTFRTRADTEVIVHLYEEEGIDLMHSLRGMFALAVWDRRARRLLLARDRLGIKPLYYAPTRDGLLFASEINALLAAGVASDLDTAALGSFFRLGYVPAPATCYRHIRAVPPGWRVVLKPEGRQTARWWRLTPPRDDVPTSFEDAAVRLRDLVEESVRVRLLSDVPLGAFLSGGLDSTLVVGTMARLMGRPVESFTIGFDAEGFDEREQADAAATHFMTNQHLEVAAPDSLDVIDEVVDRCGQPFADPSAVPTLLVSRLARRHVTVSLSGDGGDELFGGYTRYQVARSQQWYDRVPRALRAAAADLWPTGLRGRGAARIAARSFAERYVENNAMTTADERGLLLEPEMRRIAEAPPFALAEELVRDIADRLDCLDDLLLLDLHSYLPDVILTKVDRMSMACSLEARVPLLDHYLVEYVFALPLEWRMGVHGSKRLLRHAFRDLYPEGIRRRGKHGFKIPLDAWLAGPLRERLFQLPEMVRESAAPLRPEGVRELVESHLAGRRAYGRKLWAVLLFTVWWRRRSAAAASGVALKGHG